MTMARNTWIVIIIVGLIAVGIVSGAITFKFREGTPGNVLTFSGRVTLNMIEIKRVDGSAYGPIASSGGVTNVASRVIHGSMDYNDKVGTVSSAGAITGDVSPSDNGIWYLIIDYVTNNTYWLDAAETRKSAYVSRVFGWDGDIDGFDEEVVMLDFSNLSPLVAGESSKAVELTLVYSPARTSSISYLSLTNSTGILTTAYSYETATGYVNETFIEGDMAKIAKVQVSFNSTSKTYPDTEQWKLVHLKLGPYTWTQAQFGAYDLANSRYELLLGDQVNSQGGSDLYYAKNAGDLWAAWEIKAYCKYAAAVTLDDITISIYFYKPDGSITSATTRVVSFTA